MNETEKIAYEILNNAVKTIYDEKYRDRSCQTMVEKSVCFFVFPFCSNDGTRFEYCREDCEYLFEICGQDLNQASSECLGFVNNYTRLPLPATSTSTLIYNSFLCREP